MRPSLTQRVRDLVRVPRYELARTIADAGDVRSLLPDVLPLAALGAVARYLAIGVLGIYAEPAAVLFGMRVGGGWTRSPSSGAIDAVAALALGFGGWLGLAELLGMLAPRCGGRRDLDAARKLAAIIATPLWLAGVSALFRSIPYLTFLEPLAHLVGLGYGVLLGIWGAPLLLGTPERNAAAHVLGAVGAIVIAAGGLWWLLALIVH
jgi:hypothetical protein